MEVKLGLIGKGNVGTEFLKLLKEKEKYLEDEFNIQVKLIAVFELDGALINKFGLNIEKILGINNLKDLPDWKKNISTSDIICDFNLDILVEATPTNPDGGEPALSYILMALQNSIHVISSNKGPFYWAFNKIKETARKSKRMVKFEATVACCVPILSIKEHLLGNEIIGIKAILNGTSNYILSRMTSEGISFSMALKEAQELGYAETNPRLDIEGYDAAGKLVIIANELLGWSKNLNDVKIQGIKKVTPEAIELAKGEGYVIKPLAIAEDSNLIVEPRLIKTNSPLNLNGTLNVIELKSKYAGSIILIGRGAGSFEAASAIFNDFIYIIKNSSVYI